MILKREKNNKAPQIGPIYADESIPYDYFIVIDAGSHGSRVYVYSWLNPVVGIENEVDFALLKYTQIAKPVEDNMNSGKNSEKNSGKYPSKSESETDSDDDDEDYDKDHDEDDDKDDDNDSDDDEDNEKEEKPPGKKISSKKSKKPKKSNKKITKSSKKSHPQSLPKIFNLKSWHKSVRPGLASLHKSPKAIEKHIKQLLRLASDVIPKSQHHRTPIFLHATAGMRLIPDDTQKAVLDNVCSILTNQSDFYIPDCASHINVIDGETEGLYGWLALNYLKRTFNTDPQENHMTYGFLDMGGMSTQVVFQPNKTESENHPDYIYELTLAHLPSYGLDLEGNPSYASFNRTTFKLSTRSFLGLGESGARLKFLENLTQSNSPEVLKVNDPCSPQGYQFQYSVNGKKVNLLGSGNFEECIVSVFSVFSGYYTPAEGTTSDCHDIQTEDHISSCLLNSKYPAFDFEHNKFIGVSEYKKVMSDLRKLGFLKKKSSRDYNYLLFRNATQKVCSLSNKEVATLSIRGKTLERSEIVNLCFQSSWILNVLHVGLGFPNTNDEGPTLLLEERIEGQKFSWTLGRALLYANDEYTQAFANVTETEAPDAPTDSTEAPGAFNRLGYKTLHGDFIHGAEVSNYMRPGFLPPLASTKFTYYDYEAGYSRILSPYVQVLLLVTLLFAMIILYRGGLKQVVGLYEGVNRVVNIAKGYSSLRLNSGDIELSQIPSETFDEEAQFAVDSDSEENLDEERE